MFILEACNGNSMSFATWVSNMQLWGLADRTGEKKCKLFELSKIQEALQYKRCGVLEFPQCGSKRDLTSPFAVEAC